MAATEPSDAVPFLKGHGTGNDFVLLPDPDGVLALRPAHVRALCDRRFGIGGDGVLRVVPSAAVDLPAGLAGDSEWFMDYRNADGSTSEMCGNGARVFARYLVDSGLVATDEFDIGTRGGVRCAVVPPIGDVSVSMGPVTPVPAEITVELGERSWPGHGALAPNPHAVAFVEDVSSLGSLTGSRAVPDEAFPAGVNVEYVQILGPGRVRMRVEERGVGETLSCGTGACAAAWVYRETHDKGAGQVRVAVPGGDVVVGFGADGEATLTGPAEIVASGNIDPRWWESIV